MKKSKLSDPWMVLSIVSCILLCILACVSFAIDYPAAGWVCLFFVAFPAAVWIREK